MNSAEMLDVLQKYFEEIDFFYGRPTSEAVTFFQSIHGRTFKGQAFAKADDFIRVELWLNLFASAVDYDKIRTSIKLINNSLKESQDEKWIMYVVDKEGHHLGVFMDIVADRGCMSIEKCRAYHKKMVEHVEGHLVQILP